MSKIVVVGSINMDVVARTTQHPQAGEMVFGQDLHYILLVDYLIVNETELAYFAGDVAASDDIDTIQAYVRQFRVSPGQTVIATLGAKGLLCIQGDDTFRLDSIQVNAIDTTGAGDCFTAALAVGFYEKMPLNEALLFANTVASLSVQIPGASASMPCRSAVETALDT